MYTNIGIYYYLYTIMYTYVLLGGGLLAKYVT